MAVVASTGCFFTDDINGPPTAEIFRLNEEQTLHEGGLLELSAFKSDDRDGDRLIYSWSARSCESMTSCSPAFASRSGPYTEFAVAAPNKQLIAVELRVTDEHGAEDTDSEFYAVTNRVPRISALQVQGAESPAGAFTVGRTLNLVVAAQDDDASDTLSYVWTLYPASGSVPGDVEWTELSATSYRLRPDVDGLWNVTVTVEDGDGGSDLVEEAILVDVDRPPCIAATEPRAVADARYVLERGQGPRRFAVSSVVDELDPYPLPAGDAQPDRGEARFRWQLASPATGGAFVELAGHALADYTIDPSAFAPGDELALRVEVADRVDRTLPCAESSPTCSVGDDGCLQRVSWGVQVR